MKTVAGRPGGPAIVLAALGVFVGASALFTAIAFRAVSDLPDQARFVADCIQQHFVPVLFLVYLVVALVTLFSTNTTVILAGFAVVLGAAVAGKFVVSARAVLDGVVDRGLRGWATAGTVGLLLAFCLPLPGQHWYLGQFPPNLWHNATIISMMPFGVLLYLGSVAFLRDGEPRRLAWLLLFVVLNLVTKPSLFLCFAPVFPLFVLQRFGWSKRFVQACLVVAAGCAVILVQYLIIYHDPAYDRMARQFGAGDAAVRLGWLHVWRLYSSNIPLSIANSLLLPGAFLLAYPKACWRDDAIRYAAALLAVGLIIFATVYETGAREAHGNYSFQNPACNYLLHLAVLAAFVRQKLSDPVLRARDWALVGVFLLEVASGVFYLARFVHSGSYV